MFAVAALALPCLGRRERAVPSTGKVIWLSAPPAVLLVQCASLIAAWRFAAKGEVIDSVGRVWPADGLLETTALVSIGTCGCVGTIGLLRGWAQWGRSNGPPD